MAKSDTIKTKAWEIKYAIWEKKEYNESIALVIDQIADEFSRQIPEGPPLGFKPVVLINALYYDHRIYWPLHHDYYKIGLDVAHFTFCKAAYQISHELTHIYCDPRIVNWFIEIICHVTSFYFLDFLSEKWENQPHDSVYYKNSDVFGWEKICQRLEYLPARRSIRRRGRVGKKAGRTVQVVMKGVGILKKSPVGSQKLETINQKPKTSSCVLQLT